MFFDFFFSKVGGVSLKDMKQIARAVQPSLFLTEFEPRGKKLVGIILFQMQLRSGSSSRDTYYWWKEEKLWSCCTWGTHFDTFLCSSKPEVKAKWPDHNLMLRRQRELKTATSLFSLFCFMSRWSRAFSSKSFIKLRVLTDLFMYFTELKRFDQIGCRVRFRRLVVSYYNWKR